MTEQMDWHDLEQDNPPPDPWGDTTWAETTPAESAATASEDPPSAAASGASSAEPGPTSAPSTSSDGRPGTTTSLRDRVLAHPDLAARLCDPPLRYRTPEDWNGYVPIPTWQGKPNNCRRRLQLVGIIAELEGRERAQKEQK